MKMKSLLTLALSSLMLFSCGETTSSSSTSQAVNHWKDLTTISESETLGIETTFTKLDAVYKKQNTSHPGTVEKFEYTTDAYEDGVTYKKYANVYLPYGYDANDTSKQWNIMYYQHGDKRTQDVLVTYQNQNTDAKNQLDNLFDPDRGAIDPCIIVFTTLYLVEDTSYVDDNTLAGDNGKTVPANYNLELREDIVPGIEAKYNGYSNHDVSETNLVATRDHRCFAGYSRGAARTWAMFIQNYDLFRWYNPMSCPITGTSFGSGNSTANTDPSAYDDSFQQMVTERNKFSSLPFFIYGYTGNTTNDFQATRTWLKYLYDHNDFTSYGKDTSKNNFYVSVSTYDHVDTIVPEVWYNSLKVIFH